MQIVTPSRLPLQQLPPAAGYSWPRRVRTKPPVVCMAGRVQRTCQLAAAAVLSSAVLQCAVPLEPALCASVAAVRCGELQFSMYSQQPRLSPSVLQVSACWTYLGSQTCLAGRLADARSGQQVHALRTSLKAVFVPEAGLVLKS